MSDVRKLLETIEFSAERHRNQRRKDAQASPYINHPIALATLLAATGGVEDLIVLQAAILHDTVEDTETTNQELIDRFGKAVAGVVAEVTDDKALPKAKRKEIQVEHALHTSSEAALVKIADKICNLRDMVNAPPADWPQQRRRDYFDWAKKVVKNLPTTNSGLMVAFDEIYLQRP